jgi:hypothetical protein
MSNGIPASQAEAAPSAGSMVASSSSAPSFLRRSWEHWMELARAVGVVQTRLMMIAFYFAFVLPLGLVLRGSRDPLHLRKREGGNWSEHHHQPRDVESARRQF